MKKTDIFAVWWGLLRGRAPFLSIEITKECPLRCPGCYAFSAAHLGNGTRMSTLADSRGAELVDKVVALVRAERPVHLSIVGGEPLVRYRDLNTILPRLGALGVEVQVVTSAVRPIPSSWADMPWVHMAVSVDGLPPEHNVRRAPATYDRILKNIAGHKVIIHCTVTQQMSRPGYLDEFCAFWSARDEARKIWFSLYTPQTGEVSRERLTPEARAAVVNELALLRRAYPKVDLPGMVLDGLARPPASPGACVFANITACKAADLRSAITPCQIGGRPECTECGCLAAAGFAGASRLRLAGPLTVGEIFWRSRQIGLRLASRKALNGRRSAAGEAIQEANRRARETATAAGR